MYRRGPVIWSPIEEEYLKAHRDDPVNQLTICLAKSRAAIKRKLDEFDGKTSTRKMGKRSVIGRREDLDQFFRSNWEANVARWYNHKGKAWEYEPTVFSFLEHGVRRGTVSYCPDFKVGTLWVEVKGLLDPKGKTAIRRFKRFYPKEFAKLRAIVGRPGTKADEFFKEMGVPVIAYINQLNKKFGKIVSNWE
jgi:hypothetical protein